MRAPLVCAPDLTATSRPALQQALRLAAALHTDLSVLYVSPPPYPDSSFRSLAAEDAETLDATGERVRRRAAVALEDLVRDAKTVAGLPGLPTHTHVVEGMPADRIVAEARALGAELIVVGTHARTGLPHLLLGSVAERVMRTADRPVMTVAPWAGPA